MLGRFIYSSELLEVYITDGIIREVKKIFQDGDYPYISPGFFDIQVNGYAGIDYSSDDLSGDDPEKVAVQLRKSGTTRHLPTIITGPEERIIKNLEKMSVFFEERPDLLYAVPGFHIEGPYISGEDGPRGAHDVKYVRDPDFKEFKEWQEAARGRIKIVTLAPERKGAIDFIKRITGEGIIAAIGHTTASPEIIREAVKAGAKLSTHLGNGSHAELHRLNNYIWEQLACDNLSSSIISDGFHLPPAVLKTFYRTKGLDKLILISDISPLGGLEPGEYSWDNIKVEVFDDGHIGLAGTPYLAGAGHMLDRDIAHFINDTGCSLKEAVKFCTANPSELISVPMDFSTLKPGIKADLVLFRYENGWDRLKIERVV